MEFVCNDCEDTTSSSYLAVATRTGFLHDEPCDVSNFGGTQTPKGNLRTESFLLNAVSAGSTTFRITPIDGRNLAFGQFYKLCIDLDGGATDLGFGFSGEYVYVSPISKIEPRAINKAAL